MSDREPVEFVSKSAQGSRLAALVRYWREKCGGRPAPSRADIDPLEIPRLLSIVLIADLGSAGGHLRLLGSETTNALGGEMRGRPIGDLPLGEFTETWRRAFTDALASLEPTAAGGTFTRQGVANRVEAVLMPLTGESGAVEQIFGGLVIKPILYYARSADNTPITYIRDNLRRPGGSLDQAGGPGRARGASTD
jgi:hypothetical protein